MNDNNNPLAGVTADVAAILGHETQKEETAALPTWQRNQKRRDARRVKITVDCTEHPDLEQALRNLAERENTGVSSMALWVLKLGLERVQREGLQPRKRESRSLKHAYDVVIDTHGDFRL